MQDSSLLRAQALMHGLQATAPCVMHWLRDLQPVAHEHGFLRV
jgi:hypothetical protein